MAEGYQCDRCKQLFSGKPLEADWRMPLDPKEGEAIRARWVAFTNPCDLCPQCYKWGQEAFNAFALMIVPPELRRKEPEHD